MVNESRLVLVGLLLAIVVQRLLELRLARRNAAWARSQGAIEFGADHYHWFFPLHVGWLLGCLIEGLARGPILSARWWFWLAAFVVAQGLRGLAIASLGRRWNTRILVIPGRPPVTAGLYRVLAHPNYIAVGIELASVPLMFGAVWTALVASACNLVLLLGVRIPAETAALRSVASSNPNVNGG